MKNLVKDNIGLLLKSINYENTTPTSNNNMNYTDTFLVVAKSSDVVEFEISRKLVVDLQMGFTLTVVARMQMYAKKGVDLINQLTDEIIEANKIDISGTAVNFISALITQVTGSFNCIPIVTVPTLKIVNLK